MNDNLFKMFIVNFMSILVDSIFYNACIYTANSNFDKATAMAVKAGIVVDISTDTIILGVYTAPSIYNLNGKAVFPGFFDAHCHFLRYAQSLCEADLSSCRSEEEMITLLLEFHRTHSGSKALIGRGWDQTLWASGCFPSKQLLDELFPDIPVLLTRIDLHAALVNTCALYLAAIQPDTEVDGGIIMKNEEGQCSGILIDNAIKLVEAILPSPDNRLLADLLIDAQQNCLAVGLTTLSDALSYRKDIDLYADLQARGLLHLRLYCMIDGLAEADKAYYFQNGKIMTTQLKVCCVKYFSDGALGSRGAWLSAPYEDAPTYYGLPLLAGDMPFEKHLEECYRHGFQVATHAIGDAANGFVLDKYIYVLPPQNNCRWRLEHAQIIQDIDLNKLGLYHILPSVQPTHATSDMRWVAMRIGLDRLSWAYRWRDLLAQNNILPLGSDFPVENINPLLGFYAAVACQDLNGYPPDGFLPHNALSRQEALWGMTLWAAYTNFSEAETGSLEVGKQADFVLLDRDIMQVPTNEIPMTKVLETWIGGQKRWALQQ